MSNIFLYAHGGSGNHGCEAIVRSTIKILKDPAVTLISSCPAQDRKYGVDQLCALLKDTSDKNNRFCLDFLTAYAALKIRKDYVPLDKLWYKESFSHIHHGDITLSIGGDNYCYADVQKYVMLHDLLKKRRAKTVLWGCSVEPAVAARPEISIDLKRYNLITARETISYQALRAVNPNTILVSDPAFALGQSQCTLPDGFPVGNAVGINVSPMLIDNEQNSGITMENYQRLIQYIIETSDMQIALIPHVVWADGDDRIPLKKLYDCFADTGRVVIIEDHPAEELKYIISQCRFFVGARTHATIAAYSTCVPTLVVGYSVKARGLATDIFGTDEHYVLPVQALNDADNLVQEFIWLMEHEKQIHCHLQSFMPEYCGKAYAAGAALKKLLK